jgi:4-hydroxy-tetrahydrodipicolinate synthase
MPALNWHGVLPATITPFTERGDIDVESLESYVSWMKSVPGVTGVVVNGHAGEGTSLTQAERVEIIRRTKDVLGDELPVIAGVGGDGTRIVAEESAVAAEAGADALLVFPAPSWLRFGYQEGAPHERYRAVHAASGLPTILFQFPVETRASYPLEILLELCEVEGVVAIKEGSRNMVRWDTDIPVIRRHFPHIPILTCQDEFLLHSMWESDGTLVGYGALVPELMVELLETAKAHDYDAAKAVYDRMAPLTKAVYHRASHIESTPAMKIGLVQRGLIKSATVRAPLMALDGLSAEEIRDALKSAGIETA